MHSEDYKNISPFLLFDHASPKYFPPTEQKLGVGEHPHRGFETVTFALRGEVEHRDSGGGGGTIAGGRHLQFASDTPVTNLFLTVLDRLGVPMESLGDSTGQIKQLSEV